MTRNYIDKAHHKAGHEHFGRNKCVLPSSNPATGCSVIFQCQGHYSDKEARDPLKFIFCGIRQRRQEVINKSYFF